MDLNMSNAILTIIVSIVIILCSIGIITSSRFQRKQKKKYKEISKLIKENENLTFQVKNGLTKEDINSIDNEVDVDLLMKELYDTYLQLENKIKESDTNLDNILVGYLKELSINKIEIFKNRGFAEITDGIELINYSITEYNKEKLKFRVTINCFSYKKVDNQIVSGSNLEKVERIILLSYEKVNGKWLIIDYDKIYEKKLSD
ncbi:MAG: hypothetical protein E7174_00530 [Firmicutes bacterium]|nr:hypothetical protein [Bacillota bacterium]